MSYDYSDLYDDDLDADDFAGTLVTIDASAVSHGLEIDGNRLANKIIGGSGNDIFIYKPATARILSPTTPRATKLKSPTAKFPTRKSAAPMSSSLSATARSPSRTRKVNHSALSILRAKVFRRSSAAALQKL